MATETHSADTCARCRLKRATSALEEKGLFVRLCDDCYRGKEELAPAAETKTEDAAQRRASLPTEDLRRLAAGESVPLHAIKAGKVTRHSRLCAL